MPTPAPTAGGVAATGRRLRAAYTFSGAGFTVGWLHTALDRQGWLGTFALVAAVLRSHLDLAERGAVIGPFGGTGRKVLLSLAALGVTGALAGMGTFATLTATTSASYTLASGTVNIALGNTGASTNRLTVNASGLVPADTVQRSFDLSNTGSQDLASVALTTSRVALVAARHRRHQRSPDGDRPVLGGLDRSGSNPAFTYTCSGSTTTIITSRAVIQSALTMPGLGALTAGATDHLRLTLTFPRPPAPRSRGSPRRSPTASSAPSGPGRPTRSAAGRAIDRAVDHPGLPRAAALVLLVAGLGPLTGAYRLATVLSGSMGPGMPTGSVAVLVPVDPADLPRGRRDHLSDPHSRRPRGDPPGRRGRRAGPRPVAPDAG